MHCPYCGAEVTTGAASCTQCEVGITWDGVQPTFETRGTLADLIRVTDPAVLPVIESLLATANIPFVVANEVTQDMFSLGRLASGYNFIAGPPTVRVPEECLVDARELLAAQGHVDDAELARQAEAATEPVSQA